MSARILLADDHTLLLEAFQQLLEPKYRVVGTIPDGRALLEAAPRLKPDIIIMDISMPRLNGLDAGKQIKEIMPGVKLIYLTVNEDPSLVAEAFRTGASGYLLKKSAASELFRALREVLQGKSYVTPLVTRGLLQTLQKPGNRKSAENLTPRQREVLQLLAEGHSMKEVGAILHVSARTIAFHKYRMMEQLGIRTNAELIRYAIRNGIVSPGPPVH